MAKSVNQVILLGHLVADSELRTTPSGKQVASFTIGVSRMSKQEGADFFDVTAWDKLAELMQEYTSKGSKVLVMGRLNQQTWDDKETGKKRSKVVVTAQDITFLDNKQSEAQSKPAAANDSANEAINLDDIPF